MKMVKEVAILDSCNFALNGMKCIINCNDGVNCSLSETKCCDFFCKLSLETVLDDAIIYVGNNDFNSFYVINSLLILNPPPKITVAFDKINDPTLRLIRSFGIRSFISRGDSICKIIDLLTGGKSLKIDGDDFLLTEKERIIIIDLLNGIKPEVIARDHLISEKTISVHKRNVLKKIGVTSINIFFRVE